MTEFKRIREREKTWDTELVQHTVDGDLYKVTNGYPGDYVLIKDGNIQLLRKVRNKFKEIRPLHEDENEPRRMFSETVELPHGYVATSDMFDNSWYIKSPEGKEIGYVDSRADVDLVAKQLEQGIPPQVKSTYRQLLGYP